MLAHQADAAETRSRHTLRSPIELPEPARLGMLAPLSAQLGVTIEAVVPSAGKE